MEEVTAYISTKISIKNELLKRLSDLLLIFPFFGISQTVYKHSYIGEKIDHHYYSLSYSEKHEQAEWVYYTLNNIGLSGTTNRTNNFRSDTKVSSDSASPNDYTYTGFDRGHLAPASDMKITLKAMSESFLMSNISPQIPSFNRGGWKKLESLVRSWAKNYEIHIVTAGVLSSDLAKLGESNVSIPKYFYKIIYAPSKNKMIGFFMPNVKVSQNLTSFVKTVDEIEFYTGIDFFFNLPDEEETFLESNVDVNDWDFNGASKASKPKFKSTTSVSARCKGYSKSTGNRCKNKTKNKNQYCHLHKSSSTKNRLYK